MRSGYSATVLVEQRIYCLLPIAHYSNSLKLTAHTCVLFPSYFFSYNCKVAVERQWSFVSYHMHCFHIHIDMATRRNKWIIDFHYFFSNVKKNEFRNRRVYNKIFIQQISFARDFFFFRSPKIRMGFFSFHANWKRWPEFRNQRTLTYFLFAVVQCHHYNLVSMWIAFWALLSHFPTSIQLCCRRL